MLYTSSYPDTIQSHPLIAYSATSVFDVLFRTSFHFWNHNFWFPLFPISLHFSHWPLENASPLIFCHSHPPLRPTKPGETFCFLPASPPPSSYSVQKEHSTQPCATAAFFLLQFVHSPRHVVFVATVTKDRCGSINWKHLTTSATNKQMKQLSFDRAHPHPFKTFLFCHFWNKICSNTLCAPLVRRSSNEIYWLPADQINLCFFPINVRQRRANCVGSEQNIL